VKKGQIQLSEEVEEVTMLEACGIITPSASVAKFLKNGGK
jgi:hypothetical protein